MEQELQTAEGPQAAIPETSWVPWMNNKDFFLIWNNVLHVMDNMFIDRWAEMFQ